MKRIVLATCFSVLAFACTGDEEPQGVAGASGSSGSSGQSGQAGSISAGGAAGASAVDGSAGTSAGGASGSPISLDASDASSDASKEANVAEGSSDALQSDGPVCLPLDGGTQFLDVLRDGIWLLGWSGNLDHFSWLKFGFLTDGGRNGLLSVKNAGPNDFYFPCEGNDGLFSVDADNFEVVLQMPQSCADSGYTGQTIRFPLCFSSGALPKGALLHASFVQAQNPMKVDGYMFPLDYCGANFTSCPNPFAPDQ